MRELKEILKKNNIKARGYQKIGNSVVVDDDSKKYVINKHKYKKDILKYLNSRNFNYYPKIYDSTDDYDITEYIEDNEIPKEQKMNDLIHLTSLLHNKTTFYREVDEADYKTLFEDLLNNCEYLQEYYTDLITIIESKVFMSPPEYLLALNITLIFDSIGYCQSQIKKWYDLVSDTEKTHKMRVSVIHNNLSLDHYLKDQNDYLISWGKSKIDIPIFDLYKLYIRNALEFDFLDILKLYEKEYPLKDEELLLFYILISMPIKIEFNKPNYDMCLYIQREVDKLIKTSNLINNYRKLP